MKKYLAFVFLIALLGVLVLAEATVDHASRVLHVFYIAALPSLAPAMILDYLFLYSDGLNLLVKISRKMHIKNTKSAFTGAIIFLSILSGTPALLGFVDEAIKKGYYTKNEGQHLVNSFTMPSLPFLISLLILQMDNFRIKWWIFGLILVVNCLFYLLFYKKNADVNIKIIPESIDNTLEKSLLASAKTLIIILGSMILFSLPFILLKPIMPFDYAMGVLGLFEFSYSLSYLVTQNTIFSVLSIVAIITFGSCSVFAQAKCLCKDISVMDLIKKRSFLTVFNVIMAVLFII